jgi:subtilisin family serine protease
VSASRASWAALVVLATAGVAHADTPLEVAVAAGRAHPKLGVGVAMLYTARPGLGGGRLPALADAPIVVELASRSSPADEATLEAAGMRIARRHDGSAVGHGRFVAGHARADALEAIAALSRVRAIEPGAAPFGTLGPLDELGAEVQAHDVWRALDPNGLPVTGAGITACVLDVGLDVMHPVFFRADGGYVDWIDVDRDGRFTAGVDTTASGAILGVLDSHVFDYQDGYFFGSDDPGLQAGLDWVYADVNGNGARDRGSAAGFTDATPSFGEPLYAVDDVDDDGVLDPGERLVALGSSKVRTYFANNVYYTRGTNLIDAPAEGTFHGTASSSILLGGERGLGRFVGLAPDAELVMVRLATTAELYFNTDFCLSQGARVVLHEYAPWQGFALDGSSALEDLITTSTAGGVAHIHPAGNLSGSSKAYRASLPAGGALTIPIDVPARIGEEAPTLFGFSLLWRNERELALTFRDASGTEVAVGSDVQQLPFHDGMTVASSHETSSRGTSRTDIYVFSAMDAGVALSAGTWTVDVDDVGPGGGEPTELFAFVQDDASGWGIGARFLEGMSEDHLIGYPGTSDVSIVVAAYTGHGFDGDVPGTRAPYSGRGQRIDGFALLSVSAPDDPIAAAHFQSEAAPMGPFGGTSAASPMVAGAAALLFQADPARTGARVRDELRGGALADAATGAVPNADWGYGKLRVYKSLTGIDPAPGAPPAIVARPTHLDVKETATVAFDVSDADDDPASLRIELDRDYDGVYEELLAGPSFSVRYTKVGVHHLKLRATDPSGRTGEALARVEVHAVLAPSGGALCAYSPLSGARHAWLLVVLFAGLRRRTRERAAHL